MDAKCRDRGAVRQEEEMKDTKDFEGSLRGEKIQILPLK